MIISIRSRLLAAATAAAMACGALLSFNCGILLAPIAVPAALSSNPPTSIQGTIVDDLGNPLDHVSIHTEIWHSRWDFWSGVSGDMKELNLTAGPAFHVERNGSNLKLEFSKTGYYPHALQVGKDQLADMTRFANRYEGIPYPLSSSVKITLTRKDQVFPRLDFLALDIDYDDPRQFPLIDLSRMLPGVPPQERNYTYRDQHDRELLARSRNAVQFLDADHLPTPLPAHMLWTKVVEQPVKFIGPDRQIAPESRFPQEVILHLTDPDSGFILYAPHLGEDPLDQMTAAPTTGYVADLVLDSSHFRALRYGQIPYQYFYFRTQDMFGKGALLGTQNSNSYFTIQFYLYLQPDGTGNLKSLGFPIPAK